MCICVFRYPTINLYSLFLGESSLIMKADFAQVGRTDFDRETAIWFRMLPFGINFVYWNMHYKHTWVLAPSGARGGQIPGARVTGCCEPPDGGAENQTWVLWKIILKCWSPHSSISVTIFLEDARVKERTKSSGGGHLGIVTTLHWHQTALWNDLAQKRAFSPKPA